MKLTKQQIELGGMYLAMSNMCTLDPFRKQITDIQSLKQAVHQAWESAVTGTMEGMDEGYDDRNEDKAIRLVDREAASFRQDLRVGGKRAKYWIDKLNKEIPYWVEA